MAENLWGELPTGEGLRTPVAILQEQAKFLTDLTKGLLVGRVVIRNENNQLGANFAIVAPTLNNYTNILFSITYPIELYPLNFYMQNRGESISSELSFIVKLRTVLSSDQTKKLINALLAQVRAQSAPGP